MAAARVMDVDVLEVPHDAEVLDPLLQLSDRRAVVGAVEIENLTTGQIRPVCSFDPVGAGGARP